MQNAIIVHGSQSKAQYYDPAEPTASNSNWIPWLQKQLMIRDIRADAPEMPRPFKPDYAAWCQEIEHLDIGPETALIGHSAGGSFWVRYLSEHPSLSVGKVILVAPWLDPNNIRGTDFFDYAFDPDLAKRTHGLHIFHSSNDHEGISWSVQMLCQILNEYQFQLFENYGHFSSGEMGDSDNREFPELLQVLL